MLHETQIIWDLEQGSFEWKELRRSKITATDARVILGVDPFKNKRELYEEKVNNVSKGYVNSFMERGKNLEPIALELFNLRFGYNLKPAVAIKGNFLCSLDGLQEDGQRAVEIKCPGEKNHQLAIQGKIPEEYFPQLQHTMFVLDIPCMYYFSFDGMKGVSILVERDKEYINKMIEEENKFYEMLINRIPPEDDQEIKYIHRDDELWQQYALKWKSVNETIKELEKEEEQLRQNLIQLAGESNTKGAGILLCQVERKGTIDYSKIPELKNINLENYRKNSSKNWRIITN